LLTFTDIFLLSYINEQHMISQLQYQYGGVWLL